MFNEIIIDKTTYKIMKYLYGKKYVEFPKIEKKFGEENAQLVRELIRGKYAVHIHCDGKLSLDTFDLGYTSKIALIVPGNKYVEDRRASTVIRITPIFVSIVSVIVSIISLVISITLSNSEIVVHLLK